MKHKKTLADSEILLKLMRRTGKSILDLQKTDFSIAKKSNQDLVTEADLLANQILQAELKKQFPNDGWLSEESVDDVHRMTKKRVWIIDPIDGTKEYAQRLPEYAISVALVEDGGPILASVFNPATNELFHAVKGQGAWLNGSKIKCRISKDMPKRFSLLASRSEVERGEWKKFKYHVIQPIGSIAYKLALIAAGRAHATFSLGAKNEWDIAAGYLLVAESGGIVVNKKKEPIIFNQPNPKIDGIVASSYRMIDSVIAMIDIAK